MNEFHPAKKISGRPMLYIFMQEVKFNTLYFNDSTFQTEKKIN